MLGFLVCDIRTVPASRENAKEEMTLQGRTP